MRWEGSTSLTYLRLIALSVGDPKSYFIHERDRPPDLKGGSPTIISIGPYSERYILRITTVHKRAWLFLASKEFSGCPICIVPLTFERVIFIKLAEQLIPAFSLCSLKYVTISPQVIYKYISS